MPAITLAAPWTYRTVEKTIDYPAGQHDVPEEVAAQARAAGVFEIAPETPPQPEGVIDKEPDDGGTDRPAAPRKTRAAHPRKS
jgi:hypothetical protein